VCVWAGAGTIDGGWVERRGIAGGQDEKGEKGGKEK